MALIVDALREADWPAGREIHREGIATGNATFETEPQSWPTFDRSHLTQCRLAAREDGRLLGWAALSPTSDRCAYAGVAEVSVYVAAAARGRGVGGRLLAGLVEASERAGLWTLQAGIFPENEASLAIHRANGFRLVGTRRRVGQLAARWRDVAFLERRSLVVGTDDAPAAPSSGGPA